MTHCSLIHLLTYFSKRLLHSVWWLCDFDLCIFVLTSLFVSNYLHTISRSNKCFSLQLFGIKSWQSCRWPLTCNSCWLTFDQLHITDHEGSEYTWLVITFARYRCGSVGRYCIVSCPSSSLSCLSIPHSMKPVSWLFCSSSSSSSSSSSIHHHSTSSTSSSSSSSSSFILKTTVSSTLS